MRVFHKLHFIETYCIKMLANATLILIFGRDWQRKIICWTLVAEKYAEYKKLLVITKKLQVTRDL